MEGFLFARHSRISRRMPLRTENHETWNTEHKKNNPQSRWEGHIRKPSLRDDCPTDPIHSTWNLQVDFYCRLLRHCPLSQFATTGLLRSLWYKWKKHDKDEKKKRWRQIKIFEIIKIMKKVKYHSSLIQRIIYILSLKFKLIFSTAKYFSISHKIEPNNWMFRAQVRMLAFSCNIYHSDQSFLYRKKKVSEIRKCQCRWTQHLGKKKNPYSHLNFNYFPIWGQSRRGDVKMNGN